MRFLPLSRRKQAGSPSAETLASRTRELITLHVRCSQHAEAKVRALCVLTLSQPGARLEALHAGPHDSATSHLRVTVALEGTETGLLDRLVDLLSSVPSVRDLYWHRQGEAGVSGTPELAASRRLSGVCGH
ncbi:hypothetical protein [Streptomyces noursei]|uniref:hypothetical protein n=1 Tax=Streptomyces noursei TaxID=1971 RepID=UPI0005C875B5